MNTSSKDTKIQPPKRTGRLFLNVILVAISILLAIAYLQEAFLLVSFAIASAAVAAIMFGLKLRPLVRRVPQIPISEQPDRYSGVVGQHRKLTLLLLLVAIMFPFMLFLSARFFDPAIWFLLLTSVAAGMGASEILFFVYRKKMVG